MSAKHKIITLRIYGFLILSKDVPLEFAKKIVFSLAVHGTASASQEIKRFMVFNNGFLQV